MVCDCPILCFSFINRMSPSSRSPCSSSREISDPRRGGTGSGMDPSDPGLELLLPEEEVETVDNRLKVADVIYGTTTEPARLSFLSVKLEGNVMVPYNFSTFPFKS